ncbi:hypothetical protein JZ751_005227 [Albula glossodonta]|uniref:Interleukin-1 receptor-associated kinase 1-binding protein 1 n=1 Tax=Albula glossodonta TaxID=121402 RepID=A0A8T2P521_9TELE|nr:hypothetical protein JZ751_005227 [Albula glossodonta]
MASSPARVFAALLPTSDSIFRDENERSLVRTLQQPTHEPQASGREVQVTGSSELSCPPDKATLHISVSSSKDSVNDVTNSVSRRLEYILQALRQHEVKVSVVFTDFNKMQSVSNVLVEKLDKTVTVGSPQFSHSTECLNKLRRQACLMAVENACSKARGVCSLLGQAVGRPLLVKEEECREWTSQSEEAAVKSLQLSTQETIRRATVFMSSHVFVSFEIRPKERARKKH